MGERENGESVGSLDKQPRSTPLSCEMSQLFVGPRPTEEQPLAVAVRSARLPWLRLIRLAL